MNDHRREIKSYVRREGRFTKRQQQAVDTLWSRFVKTPDQVRFEELLSSDQQPVHLEIGFGMGASLAQMAEQQPETRFIGVEVHRPGVAALLAEILDRKLSNVCVFCEDVVSLLQNWLPEGALDKVLILFPDPWPKKRHLKRRLVQGEFVDLLCTKLKVGGVLHLATDWAPYSEQMREVVGACSSLFELDAEQAAPFVEARPDTKFERRGLRLGYKINDIISIKEKSKGPQY